MQLCKKLHGTIVGAEAALLTGSPNAHAAFPALLGRGCAEGSDERPLRPELFTKAQNLSSGIRHPEAEASTPERNI